ncbi:MAG TPA: bifunctional oligoribonuclease/PAP phosphatase NrnA [Candidatus Avacidaminococcus intestinavium]|uniref:Bifunctional oligoribonuclease/PAP phosphatase NrnA n=1 Tax=Candidatus Avacidaminococcus intestinavium TaxID=2840684 RepID=A0A9D1SLN1_9FIRM|nr:bifunctional oligoribonuclease/PAP phosphatase NrnA [Candidatus Avacidaminococcus intestinavium]
MSERITLENAAKRLLAADNIIITSHISPDGDAIGSTIALATGLKQLGKKITMVIDDDISSYYNFIPGVTEFVRAQPDTVLQGDLLVVTDASSLDRIGALKNQKNAGMPILNIDHHISNTHYADYLYLDDKAAATGEIIYALLNLLKVQFDHKIAVALYVAIVTDCGYFKYSNTTSNSLCIAAELLKYGVKSEEISDHLEMKSKAEIELLTKVLDTLTFYKSGKIATLMLSNENYDATLSTDSFVQFACYINGVEVAVLFKAVEKNITRVSMRSRSIDVSKVALLFDGGGHKKAAGCTINGDLQHAASQLLSEIQKELDEYHV